MRIAIYPGSFDPITNGHVDLARRALDLFDKLVVAIADNPEKEYLFTTDERESMVKESLTGLDNVEVIVFSGLLADLARKTNAVAIIRGLRAISDFEFEFQMALMNRNLASKTETLFLVPGEKFTYLSSSLIKDIARFDGKIGEFVPRVVEQMLRKKFGFT